MALPLSGKFCASTEFRIRVPLRPQGLAIHSWRTIHPNWHRCLPRKEVRVAAALTQQAGNHTSELTSSSSRNLVIAVDESQDARKAFKWALSHIYRPGDVLHILHVLPFVDTRPASGQLYYVPPADESLQTMMKEHAERFLQETFVAEAQKEGVLCEGVAVDTGPLGVEGLAETMRKLSSEGWPPLRYDENFEKFGIAEIDVVDGTCLQSTGQAVCAAAEKLKAAMLIVHTHRKSVVEKLVMGSVSAYCAKHAKVPTLLLH